MHFRGKNLRRAAPHLTSPRLPLNYWRVARPGQAMKLSKGRASCMLLGVCQDAGHSKYCEIIMLNAQVVGRSREMQIATRPQDIVYANANVSIADTCRNQRKLLLAERSVCRVLLCISDPPSQRAERTGNRKERRANLNMYIYIFFSARICLKRRCTAKDGRKEGSWCCCCWRAS